MRRLTFLMSLLLAACGSDGNDPAGETDADPTSDDDDTPDDDDDDDPLPGNTDPDEDDGDPTTGSDTDADTDDPSDGSSTGEPDGPRPTPGCGMGDPGDVVGGTLEVGGTERTYLLVVPDGYDSNTLYPLIFGFHGSYDSGAGAQLGYRLEEHWDGEAIVVYPDGLEVSPGVPSWVTDPGGRDFELVVALYEAIGTQMCFDQNRAFTFGYSAGGYMANSLACFRGDLFAGAGAISAGMPGGDCGGPKAIYAGHGETDTTVPFSAGTAARDRWLAENGCAETTTPTDQEGCVAYDGCAEGAPLTWCTHPGAHSFFGWTADGAVQLFRSLP